MSETRDRRWLALILLAATQFMIVIDVSIVNVALNPIKDALKFSEGNLTWVLNAYTLTFGGLLLFGGRLADLLGRKRVFQIGVVVFALASLACGLAQNSTMLIAARAVQGMGAAIVSPAALSILSVTFTEGAERNKALGVWGAVAGMGGAVGVLAGGFLTDALSWRWIFFVNVPIAVGVILFSFGLLTESRAEKNDGGFDVAGAIAGTAGLALLIYGFVQTALPGHGWKTGQTIGVLAAAVLVLGLFIAIESKTRAPLMPLRLFKIKSVAGANIVGFLLGCSIFAMFYFISRYMGEVQHLSPTEIGVRYLLFAGVIVVAAGGSQALVTKLGAKPIMATGMFLLMLGLIWFTQIRVNGSYARDLVPGFIIGGIGLGFSFVPVSIAALDGVQANDAGVASGVINSSQQIGSAVGLGVLASVVAQGVTQYGPLGADGRPTAAALVQGYHWGFWVAAGLCLLGLIAALTTVANTKPVAGGTHGAM